MPVDNLWNLITLTFGGYFMSYFSSELAGENLWIPSTLDDIASWFIDVIYLWVLFSMLDCPLYWYECNGWLGKGKSRFDPQQHQVLSMFFILKKSTIFQWNWLSKSKEESKFELICWIRCHQVVVSCFPNVVVTWWGRIVAFKGWIYSFWRKSYS